MKRIMEKMPFGRSRTAALAAALFLLKECDECDGKDIELIAEDILAEINEDKECFLMYVSQVEDEVLLESRTISVKGLEEVKVYKTYHNTGNTFLGAMVYEGTNLLTGKREQFLGVAAC